MSTQALPPELLMIVIDNLDRKDQRTLAACSRSCKALIQPAYRRLYYKITLDNEILAQKFATAIDSSPHLPGKYVRCLSISHNRLTTDTLNSIIPILAQNLPGVISLHLSALVWPALDEGANSALNAGFQSVQQLELFQATFETEDQMLALIASFPSLTHLGPVKFCTSRHEPATHASMIPLPSNLEVLDISSRHIPIFDRLLHLVQPPNLRNLRISVSFGADRIHEFGSLLEFLGSKLESLTFYGFVELMWRVASRDPQSSIDELLAGRVISLVHNTKLRSIAIESGIFTDQSRPNHPPSVSWALSLLSQITSPHLSEINLRIVVGRVRSLDRLDWSHLDEILTRRLWRDSLKRVVIDVRLPNGVLLSDNNLEGLMFRLPMITETRSVLCRFESRRSDEER